MPVPICGDQLFAGRQFPQPCHALAWFPAIVVRMKTDLTGEVALVAGGTRGASRAIAVELGRNRATVYVTGRSTGGRPSEVNRPETIEGTAGLVRQAGGTATAHHLA